MKVKLGDIKPNPFHYLKSGDPISKDGRDKIVKLRSSIRQTGFWDNLVARKKGDKFELAYGLHRLHALRMEFGNDHEIELIVKDISDADMLKMMATENDTLAIMSPAFIDEAVRTTRNFLKKNPEEVEKIRRKVTPKKCDGYEREDKLIAVFLNWPESRVEEALAAISDMDSKEISKEEYESCRSQASAKNFRKAVKGKKAQEINAEKVRAQAASDLKRPVLTISDAIDLGWASDVNKTAREISEYLRCLLNMMPDEVVAKWDCIDPECREEIAGGIRLLYKKYQKIQKLKI